MGEMIDIYGETLLMMFAITAVTLIMGIMYNQYSGLINTILNSIFVS